MKSYLTLTFLLAAALLSATGVIAGEPATLSAKSGKAPVIVPTPEEYEANRGLVTLTGPSGMFINPTSATLPKSAFTAQYCFFLPDFDFKGTMAHGTMFAYGVNDWLEVGALTLFLTDAPGGGTDFAAGPLARIRLLKHDGLIPQLSIGGDGRFGASSIRDASAFVALTERFDIKAGPLESIAFHLGARQTWTDANDSFRGYFGTELQLPARIYLIGEISTKARGNSSVPWAAGFQWRAGGINVSTAVLEPGDGGKVGFWFGVGTVF